MKLFATRLIILLFVTPIFSQHIDIDKNKLSLLAPQEFMNDSISEQQYLKKYAQKDY